MVLLSTEYPFATTSRSICRPSPYCLCLFLHLSAVIIFSLFTFLVFQINFIVFSLLCVGLPKSPPFKWFLVPMQHFLGHRKRERNSRTILSLVSHTSFCSEFCDEAHAHHDHNLIYSCTPNMTSHDKGFGSILYASTHGM